MARNAAADEFDRFVAEMDDEDYAAMVARLDREGVAHGYEPREVES